MRKKRAAAGVGTARKKSEFATRRKSRVAARAIGRVSAKLSVPKVVDATPRARLFEWLDQHSQHSLTWISGPPGCGKTTLAASYLAALIAYYSVVSGRRRRH